MQRTTEIKSIMRQLREQKEVKNESLVTEAEVDTENDSSELELQLARLEDIISRFEKVVNAAGEEEPAEEEPAAEEAPAEEPAEEEPAEEEPAEEPAEEEEPAAEEAYSRSLEKRIADLERKFTESRRRKLCRRFVR